MIPHQALKDRETTGQQVLGKYFSACTSSFPFPCTSVEASRFSRQIRLVSTSQSTPVKRANYLADSLPEIVSSNAAHYKAVHVLLDDQQTLFSVFVILKKSL